MSAFLFVFRFAFYKLARPVGHFWPLISFSEEIKSVCAMASKNNQVVPMKKSKSTTARSSGEAEPVKKSKQTSSKSKSEPIALVTRSVARAQPTTFMALSSKPRQPVITLESLGAIKHASQSGKKQVSKENEPNEQSLLPEIGRASCRERV